MDKKLVRTIKFKFGGIGAIRIAPLNENGKENKYCGKRIQNEGNCVASENVSI